MNQELLDRGQQVLRQQPFSMLLGADLTVFVHGGAVSYLADNALTYAGGSVIPGHGAVTSEFKINYLRPAIGDALVARASVLYAGKTQIVCRCDVFAVAGAEEKLCATAQGTIAPLGAPSPSET